MKFDLHKFKRAAFTLSELLMVIGVIGVVSALTLPNLNTYTGHKQTVAHIQKLNKTFNEAYRMAVAQYGPVKSWFLEDPTEAAKVKRFSDRITQFLKISKSCGSSSGCYDADEYYKNGAHGPSYSCASHAGNQRFLLDDGTPICFVKDPDRDVTSHPPKLTPNKIFRIYVDIDGSGKGLSKWGYDIFGFVINADTEKPLLPFGAGSNLDQFEANCFNTGVSCTAWVVDFGNMDYLDADSEGKCSNGEILTLKHPTCD